MQLRGRDEKEDLKHNLLASPWPPLSPLFSFIYQEKKTGGTSQNKEKFSKWKQAHVEI